MKASPDRLPMDKIVVAIHGIGSQRRCDTIRSVARRFGDRDTPPVPAMPLGYFSIGDGGQVRLSQLDTTRAKPDEPNELERIGFAEVYWADIPREVVRQEDTLEETKAWGATVVARAEALYNSRVKGGQLHREDFALAGGVIDEVVETIDVLENLSHLADRAGVFKFDLGPLLRDYVGDVQLVTEFAHHRDRIVHRFHETMARIMVAFQAANPGQGRQPELYIVAHSEGTVISFLALLQALTQEEVSNPAAPGEPPLKTDWIDCVRGFMTIGSPIDKHLILWPRIFEHITENSAWRPVKHTIRWRNYYDHGDPIGFELDSTRQWLAEQHCTAFEFSEANDMGFSRYWLPGKAHNDYWGDAEVFGHFIDDVVLCKRPAKAPETSRKMALVSTATPYLLTMLIHLAAVFVMFKGFGALTDIGLESGKAVLEMSLLLMGVTVASRLPRLVAMGRVGWFVWAAIAFGVGAYPCLHFLTWAHTGTIVLLAGLVALSGWIATWWKLFKRPRMGRRALLASGALVVVWLLAMRISEQPHDPVWPILLAGLVFMYLWWLGILLFDLTFVWHRYIRWSAASRGLRRWNAGKDAKPPQALDCLSGTPPAASQLDRATPP